MADVEQFKREYKLLNNEPTLEAVAEGIELRHRSAVLAAENGNKKALADLPELTQQLGEVHAEIETQRQKVEVVEKVAELVLESDDPEAVLAVVEQMRADPEGPPSVTNE